MAAIVEASCNVAATAFGVHSRTATNPSSAVSVTCTQVTPFNVSLDAAPPGHSARVSVHMNYPRTGEEYLADIDTAFRVGDGAYRLHALRGQSVGAIEDDAAVITITVTY